MAEYISQKGFVPSDAPIFHGFFSRRGGASQGLYAALNCGPASGDDPAIVQQNRDLVQQTASAACLLSVYQEHGATCVTVRSPWDIKDRPKADAMVTDQAGIALGILTADCAPVLFCGQKMDSSPVIGASHAGWKGALGGILENTLEAMVGLGAQNIKACIGPCIAKASYEVSADFAEVFLNEHDESGRFFQSGAKSGHLLFDLAGYCAWRLFRAGLRSIALMDHDTYAMADQYYSYRRATHQGQMEYGRQISVISIREGL